MLTLWQVTPTHVRRWFCQSATIQWYRPY